MFKKRAKIIEILRDSHDSKANTEPHGPVDNTIHHIGHRIFATFFVHTMGHKEFHLKAFGHGLNCEKRQSQKGGKKEIPQK